MTFASTDRKIIGLITILIAASTSLVNGQQCSTLPANTACGPSFEGFTVSMDLNTFNNNIIANSNLAGATSAYISTLASRYSCSKNLNPLTQSLQDQIVYSVVHACISIIQASQDNGCEQPSDKVLALCRTPCEKHRQSLVARLMAGDCNRNYVNNANATLGQECKEWDVQGCIGESQIQEETFCGFPTLYLAKEYCHALANTNDPKTPSCCVNLLISNAQTPFLTNTTTNSSPLPLFTSSYSNIRFTLKTPYTSLCLRDDSRFPVLKLSSCYNTHTHGSTQFTYNRRDKSIQPLDSATCLERSTIVMDFTKVTYNVPVPRKCDGNNPMQKWNVTSGVDAGFLDALVPVYNFQFEAGSCINVGQSTDFGVFAVMGNCKTENAALTFAGFSNF
ncbi:hypothetical protein HDU97_006439 [Phlyctochytrium planicorne]|nr:hypothetical protein HDU97_006439 [Phlyctochytrium planicorne]